MNKTSKYSIIIDGKVVDDIGKDTLLLNMYMASMAKYLLIEHLENNRYVILKKIEGTKFTELKEVKEIMLEGTKIFFKYLDTNSKIKPNKRLKKGLKAFKNNKLNEYMFSQ